MQGRSAVPRLALASALGRSVVDAPATDCPLATARAAPAAPAPAGPQLHLSLLSPAFELSTSASSQHLEEAEQSEAQQCQHDQQQRQAPWADEAAARLGVAADRLRFYGIIEARSPSDLPPGCSRVAVEVADARFSLSAMEALLQEMAEMREREERLQAENATLRQQLRSSESLRRKGSRALVALQDEFKSLCAALTAGCGAEGACCGRTTMPDRSPAAVSAGRVQL